MNNPWPRVLAVLGAIVLCGGAGPATAETNWLTTIDASSSYTRVRDVSPDGQFVVGEMGGSDEFDQAFVWSLSNAATGEGTTTVLPPEVYLESSRAFGVTTINGNIRAVGRTAPSSIHTATRWNPTDSSPYKTLEPTYPSGADTHWTGSEARCVSDDASVFAGSSSYAVFDYTSWEDVDITEPTVWRKVGQERVAQRLGFVPGFEVNGEVRAANSNGSIVVGFSGRESYSKANSVAFVHTGGQMTALPYASASDDTAHASALSADGSVIVGFTSNFTTGNADTHSHAVKWVADASGNYSAVPLTQLLGYAYSDAMGVSADGSVLVGGAFNVRNTAFDARATVWTAGGVYDLNELLPGRYGIDLGDLVLTEVRAVSADGLTMAGFACDYYGGQVGWVAHVASPVPEPTTIGLLLVLAVCGLVARRFTARG